MVGRLSCFDLARLLNFPLFDSIDEQVVAAAGRLTIGKSPSKFDKVLLGAMFRLGSSVSSTAGKGGGAAVSYLLFIVSDKLSRLRIYSKVNRGENTTCCYFDEVTQHIATGRVVCFALVPNEFAFELCK